MQRQMEIRPGAGLDIEAPARAHGDLNPTNDLQIENSLKCVRSALRSENRRRLFFLIIKSTTDSRKSPHKHLFFPHHSVGSPGAR
jgi:hypothetical protein